MASVNRRQTLGAFEQRLGTVQERVVFGDATNMPGGNKMNNAKTPLGKSERRKSLQSYYEKEYGSAATSRQPNLEEEGENTTTTIPHNGRSIPSRGGSLGGRHTNLSTAVALPQPDHARRRMTIAAPAAGHASAQQVMRPRGSIGPNDMLSMGGAVEQVPRSARKVAQQDMLMSAAPAMSARMSIYGGGVGGGVVVERRDFSTNAAMTKHIRRVIDFLVQRGYPREISEHSLISPTVATFRDVFVSMASLMDPTAAEDIANKARMPRGGGWEIAVCALLKNMRYPLQLSPKQLNAVGSANAWPKFLGALVWLADLFDADDLVQQAVITRDVERAGLFDFLSTSYVGFMQGDDSAFEKILSKLRVDVEQQSKEATKKCDEVRMRVSRLEAELTSLNEQDGDSSGDLTHLEDRRDTLRADNVKYGNVIASWIKKKAASEAKLAQAQEEEREGEEKLRLAREEKANALAALNAQAISSDQAERLGQERVRLAKHCEQVVRRKNEVTSRVDELKRQIEAEERELKEKVNQFNTGLESLVDVSSSLSSAASPRGLVAPLEPLWSEYHEASRAPLTKAHADNARAQLQLVRDGIHTSAHSVRDAIIEKKHAAMKKRDEINELEARLGRLHAATQTSNVRYEEEEAVFKREYDQLDQQRRDLVQRGHASTSSLNSQFSEGEMEVRNLRTQLLEEQERFERRKTIECEMIHASLAKMVDLKIEIENATKSFHEQVTQVKDNIPTLDC